MRQVILLDAHDVVSLKHGQPLVIQVGNGQTLEIGYQGMFLTVPRTERPTKTPTETLTEKHTCAHCGRQYISMGAHIRAKHPGQGFLKTGGVKCRWCEHRYPSKPSALRHEVSRHLEQFKKGKKKGKEEPNG